MASSQPLVLIKQALRNQLATPKSADSQKGEVDAHTNKKMKFPASLTGSTKLAQALEYLYPQGGITVSRVPTLVILVGPPASGKTTIKKIIPNFDFENCVNLDVDKLATHVGLGAAHYSQAIRYIAKDTISKTFNLLLDTTGKMTNVVKYVVDRAHAANYRIILAIVYSPIEICVERAKNRNRENNAEREALLSQGVSKPQVRCAFPLQSIVSAYKEFVLGHVASFYLIEEPGNTKFLSQINNVYLFDNSKRIPSIIYKQLNGIHMPPATEFRPFYNMTISTTSPFFHKISKTELKHQMNAFELEPPASKQEECKPIMAAQDIPLAEQSMTQHGGLHFYNSLFSRPKNRTKSKPRPKHKTKSKPRSKTKPRNRTKTRHN